MEALRQYSDEEDETNRSSQEEVNDERCLSPVEHDQSPFTKDRSHDSHKSPTQSHKSHIIQRRSPTHRHRSPIHHRRSPTYHRRSPTHRHRSPIHHRRSPTHRRRSPTRHRRSSKYCDRSPTNRSTNRHRSSSDTHIPRHRSPTHHHHSPPSTSSEISQSSESGGDIKSASKEHSISQVKEKETFLPAVQTLPIENKLQQPVVNKKKLLWGNKPAVKSWNNWESAAFEGDEATQSKFRRLMGIKGSATEQKAPNKGVAATSTVLKDLESQYETSRFMTHLAKGSGLGFGGGAQITQTKVNPNDTDNLNE